MLVLVLVLVPQSCASLDDLGILSPLVSQSAIPARHSRPDAIIGSAQRPPWLKEDMPARRMQAGGRACIWGLRLKSVCCNQSATVRIRTPCSPLAVRVR